MSTQPAEQIATVAPIDPDSDFGQHVTDGLARINAVVVARLRAEGKAIPGQPTDPAP